MPDYPELTITCMAASKTFNMAGLMFSNIIVRDDALRQLMQEHDKLVGFVNPLSLAANQAAYEKGGPWLQELKAYFNGNFQFVKRFLDQHLPQAVMQIPEATSLAWVNLNACLPDVDDLPMFFANEAGVLLEGGDGLLCGQCQGLCPADLAMPRPSSPRACAASALPWTGTTPYRTETGPS